MSACDKYPLGKPAFVTHILDRAAHLRGNDEKLFALEGQRNAGAYVIYRDSLLVKQEADGPRVLPYSWAVPHARSSDRRQAAGWRPGHR